MSLKFSSFDALTPQNRITALMRIKETASRKKEDFFLALHSLLDPDQQVRLAGKMIYQSFSGQDFYVDLKGLSQDEIKKKIDGTFREISGGGPEPLELEGEPQIQRMARDLQTKAKRAEMGGEWDGPFPKSAKLLNTLREDTQTLIQRSLLEGETVESAFIGFSLDTWKPFRDTIRSLDASGVTTVVNLNHVYDRSQLSPAMEAMFGQLERPVYLLVLLTSRRLILFLRDQNQTSRASVHGIPFSQITKVHSQETQQGVTLELETTQDLVRVPQLFPADGLELDRKLRELSIAAIQSQEAFIDRDFDKELGRLDLLFKARTISASEYMFRKMRLQKMEIEKFSDTNVEALLAKRFGDGTLGKKFDEQLMKKFTAVKTIMFTDMVGYSKKAAEKMLIDTMTMLAVHDRMLMPIINDHHGVLIKKIGDALMVKFEEPLEACQAAALMQAKLIEFNRTSPEKILIRIGLNTGTVFAKGQDVFGDAVNVAARMESMAQPGMIYLTEATFQVVGQTIPCRDCGVKQVKGQKVPMRVYSMIDETQADREMLEQAREFRREMGIEEPPEGEAGPAAVVAAPHPGLEPPAAATLPGAEAFSRPDDGPMPATAPPPPATQEEALAAMSGHIEAAIADYRLAVQLGLPRNGELEGWFTWFAREGRHPPENG